MSVLIMRVRLRAAMALLWISPVLGFPALPMFEPSYEWQSVPGGQSVPAGLEVQMQMQPTSSRTGHARQPVLARIPPTWRLQLWLEADEIFSRVDVGRHTTIAEIEAAVRPQVVEHRAAARRHAHGVANDAVAPTSEMRCLVTLWSHGERLPPDASVESTAVFAKQRSIIPRVECDDPTSRSPS